MIEYSTQETVEMLKESLKANFPGTEFVIRGHDVKCESPHISVAWVDGPEMEAVEPIAQVFDGSRGSILILIDGALCHASFETEFIHCCRTRTTESELREVILENFGAGVVQLSAIAPPEGVRLELVQPHDGLTILREAKRLAA